MRFLSRNIYFIIAAILFPAIFLFAGCSDDSELRAKEDEAILKHLADLQYKEGDYTVTEGVYRVITKNFFDDIEDTTYVPPVVSEGDEVALIFAIYTFSGSTPLPDNLIYTNDKSLINENINPEYWPEGPIYVTVGNEDIIRGIDVSLPGCILGDTALIIVPSRMAYGKAEIGIVGSDTMLYCIIMVTSINDENLFEGEEDNIAE